MPTAESLERLLGPDLWALAIATGSRPVEATELTSLPSERSKRASFRLVFADGTVRKGRRMRDAACARRTSLLQRLIAARHVPALLGVRDAAVLTEWSEGEQPAAEDPAVLRAAGALLGSLHSTRVSADVADEHGFPVRAWAQRLESNLGTLERLGALTRDRVAQARDMASAAAPEEPPRGLVHCDFCPENLVVGADGSLVMIDNENLTVDALPFDLARTWYRWPLGTVDAEPFWAGYRTACDPTPFLEHAVHWKIQVLGEAAAFRVAGRTGKEEVPLRALEQVLSGGPSAYGSPA